MPGRGEGERELASAGARCHAAGGAERGARLPLRLRAARARGAQPERGCRAGASVRARALLRRAPAPVRARRRAPRTPRLRDLAETLGVDTVATGDPHAHHQRRTALQDVLVAIRNRTSLDGCEPERRGNRESVLAAPGELAERFPLDRDAVERAGELAARLEFDLTEDLGYRYPDFSETGEPAIRAARPRLRPCLRGAVRRRHATRPRITRTSSIGRRASADRRARPGRVLPPALGGARAGARVRARGARRLGRAQRPPAGPRARELGRLDRLLPDRPLARRPRAGRALARAASSTTSSSRCPTSTSISRATSARS